MDAGRQKQQLRQELRFVRDGLSQNEIEQKSQLITERLVDVVDWGKIKNAHIYSSVTGWKEVDTQGLIRKIGTDWPDVRITSPTIDRTNPIPQEQFDLIIVPVLGFDENLYRLGLGGGWYDRFLALQTKALKIGLAYASARLQNLPHEPHDIALDKIITEEGIIG